MEVGMFLDGILNPDKPNVALDIGSKYVKAVSLKKIGTQIQVADFNIAELPENIEDKISADAAKKENAQINEEFKDKVSLIVKDVLHKTGAGKNVITAINSRYLVNRIVSAMGAPESNEFNSAVQVAMKEQFANYQGDVIRTSHEILKKAEGDLPSTVLIAAAKKEALDFYTDVTAKAGYKLTVIDGVPFALANIFEYINSRDPELASLNNEEKNYILVDIGFNNFNIVGVKNNFPVYFRGTFNFSDRFVIDTIKNNEGLGDADAISRKFELFAKSLDEKEKSAIKDEVLNKYYKNYFYGQTNQLVKEIEDALISMEIPKENLRKISFSGGGSFFPFLLEFVMTKIKGGSDMKLKVEMINPFFQMVARNDAKMKEMAGKLPLFATAAGLALRCL